MPLPVLDRAGRIALASLVALVALTGVSIVWSIAGDESWSALNKGIVYVGFLAVGLALAAFGTNTTRTVAGLLAAVLGAALAWALLGKAIPGLAPGDASRIARLHGPAGYWNGLALLADAALVLGLWLLVAERRRRAVQVGGATLLYVAVLAGLLTESRAGVIGGLLALGVWLWLGNRRVESAAAAVAAGVPAAVVAGWTFTRPALVDTGQTHAARVHDGAVFGILAILGLAAAVGAVLVLLPRVLPGRERATARVLVAGAAVAVAIGVAAVAAVSGNPFTKAAEGFSHSECTNTASRFGCTNNNRLRWWGEALDVFRDRPAGGAGAGTFEVARKRYRKSGDPVREPHSVPLQVIAGTGVAGGLLLVLFVGGAAAAAWRPLRDLDEPERVAAVAVSALPVAYSLHALVDYDVDFIAVTAPTMLALGVLLGAGRAPVRRQGGIVPALAAVAVAATAIVALALPWLSARKVDTSYAATSRGQLQRAVATAEDARSLDPLSPAPLYALASAYQQAGQLTAARAALTRVTRLQPENPEPWYLLGLFEFLGTHDLCAAYQALNRSYTLDQQNPHWFKGGELDQAKDAVNDKKNPACG